MTKTLRTLDEVQALFKKHKGEGLSLKVGEVINISTVDVISAEKVYQPRLVNGSKEGLDQAHITGLTKRLLESHSLDPVLALPAGDQVILIDGHHRVEGL